MAELGRGRVEMQRRMLSLVLVVLAAGLPRISDAAILISYTDRAEWEQAATLAGLTVATEDFSQSPTLFSEPPATYLDPTGQFDVGGVTFDIVGGTYDATQQNLVQSGNYDLGLGQFDAAPSVELFGFGFDWATRATVKIVVADAENPTGIQFNHVDDSGFFGVLGSLTLLPGNDRAASIDGHPPTYMDNVSVAVAPIPEPTSLIIWVVIAASAICWNHHRYGNLVSSQAIKEQE